MNRFEKVIRTLMKSIVRHCENENYFRETNCPNRAHEHSAAIMDLSSVLSNVNIYVTFDTDDKLNYTKVHFKDMIDRITITFDVLSTKERLNAMYGKYYNGGYVDTDSLSCIRETEDGYEL